MSTPPFNISDEMVEAYCAASADWLTEYRSEVRAGLEAVAPLIAVQVLRSAALDLERRAGEFKLEPGDKVRRQTHNDIARWLRGRAAGSGRERSPEPEPEPALNCPKCGSPRWVSVSLDEGYTRLAQCVPCGAVHPGVLGPGWRAQRRERSEPSKGSEPVTAWACCGSTAPFHPLGKCPGPWTGGRRSLTEDTP